MDYIDISPLTFWHERAKVVDFVKELAGSSLNTQASDEIRRWADGVTVGIRYSSLSHMADSAS